jgi:hypothetical protein
LHHVYPPGAGGHNLVSSVEALREVGYDLHPTVEFGSTTFLPARELGNRVARRVYEHVKPLVQNRS